MKRHVLVLALFLLTAVPVDGALQQRPSRETWYERVLRRINPEDIDYGRILEERRQAFAERIGTPAFQYSLAATVTMVWLFIVLYAQHVSHCRREDIAVDGIADVLKHDAYSREKAREAIRRYNEHIESCNRQIEAEESGARRVPEAEWETLHSEREQCRGEAAGLREETTRLREQLEIKKASLHSQGDSQPVLSLDKDKRIAELAKRVNELQDDLIAERRRNRRNKGNPPT